MHSRYIFVRRRVARRRVAGHRVARPRPIIATLFLATLPAVILHTLIGCGTTGAGNPDNAKTWFDGLSQNAIDSILWTADHEEGTLTDWEDDGTDTYYAGGGIFNTGGADVTAQPVSSPVHSGAYAAEATITGAVRAQDGTRAVRYMRWTDAAWDEAGDYFPSEAYYSVWMYFPEGYTCAKDPSWDVNGDGGWWNVFQFKSDQVRSDGQAVSQPVVVLNVWYYEDLGTMAFYLDHKHYPDADSDQHTNTSYEQTDPVPIPVGQWFHVEAFYKKSQDADGRVTIWQAGVQLFDIQNIQTELSEQTAWGIGNYTDHIATVGDGVEGSATVYFDDAAVSLQRLGP